MIKSEKINVLINTITEQLHELSEKDFTLFITFCVSMSDSLSEEVDRLREHENLDSICELLEDEYYYEH